MALAILQLEDSDSRRYRFRVNIGTNRFYRYAIAPSAQKQSNGLVQLDDTVFTSPLIGPIPESSLGKVVFEVPRDRLTRQNNRIQVTSFRSAQLEGPALSDVVPVVAKLEDTKGGKRGRSLSAEFGEEFGEGFSGEFGEGFSGEFSEEFETTLSPAMNQNRDWNRDENRDWSMERAMEKPSVEVVPFSYREEPPISSAMFLGAISAMIPKILPAVKTALPKIANTVANVLPTALPLVGNIISSVTGGAAGATPTPEGGAPPAPGGIGNTLLQTISNPNTAQLIASLLQQAGGAGGAAPGAGVPGNSMTALLQQLAGAVAGTPPTALAQSFSLPPLPTLTAPPLPTSAASRPLPTLTASSYALAYSRNGSERDSLESAEENSRSTRRSPWTDNPDSSPRSHPRIPSETEQTLNSTAYALDLPPQYVHEMAIPAALLTALPALMPLLEKALNPETLKTLMDNMPVNKLMGTVTDGLKQVGSMVQESEQRRFSHLEKLMPKQTTAGDINQMFQGMSLSLAAPPSTLKYQRVETVKLKFEELSLLTLYGRSRLLYHQDRAIAFPLSLTTPRPIRNATLELLVKNPATLEILIDEKYPVEQATTGALTVVPQLAVEQLRSLPLNEEYLVCVTLVWSGKSKKTQEKINLGTSMSQLITLVGDYCFDRIEGSAEVIPLNDVDKFRPYWHKVWQGSFSKSVRRIKMDCKYYFILEGDQPKHARIETLIQTLETKGTQQSNRLKSGLMTNPTQLNTLLGQISKQPPLEPAQLKALSAPEFQARFSHAARSQVEFEGSSGESVALWIYPEVKLQQVVLKKAMKVNKNGHITELSEQIVRFPMPAITHFIGVRAT